MDRPTPSRLVVVTSIVLTVGHLASRVPLLAVRRFDPDEFEHAHVAWSLLQGQVPYRDFFEHHTLLFHYLLAGFLSLFDVAGSADRAFDALFASRHLAWVVSAGVLAAMFFLARRTTDRTTAWVALPIAAGNIVLGLRAIEIRPDGLATLLWLASLAALHAAVAGSRPGSRRARSFFGLSGMLIGLAVLASQKLLMAGPPLAILLVWYVASARFGGRVADRLGDGVWQIGGVAVVWGLAVSFFAASGAAGDFLRLTLLDPLRWTDETTATTVLAFITRYDPWLFALAAGGALLLMEDSRDGGKRLTSNAVLLVPAIGLFAGLFVVPVPYPQYCLTFIPLFAILAASFVVRGVRALSAAGSWRRAVRLSGPAAAALVAFAGLAVIGLVLARPIVVAPVVYPALIAVAILTALTLPVHGRQGVSLAAVLLVLSVIPVQATRWMAELGDQGQFAELRYVLEHTEPDAVVLDGWSGYGVFRRHALYHWMLHPGVRAMLPAGVVNQMVENITSGRVVPAVVVLDANLRALSGDLAAFVEARYHLAGEGDIYIRQEHP
jgi:hypothetical protein